MAAFEELGLSKDALKAVEKLGYTEPTPVQEQAIPLVLQGCDLIAAASTGTGKTAAFLLPLLSNLPRAGRGKRAPRILVVTPTRELAQQIAFTCIKVARATGHFATTVYGGTPYGPQIRELRNGTDVLIATPGRLKDLMERGGVVDLSEIEALVLDEADRMLDMGFLPDVTTIVDALPEQRQTLLFSATIDKSIENNLGSLLHDPAVVQIAQRGETAKTVDQYIMPIAHRDKFDLLKAVLDEKGHERVIVFARTKMRAEECTQDLVDAGYSAESIHSDKSQGKRRRALENFRKGRTDILVATDVLARGIDVTGVDHVINLDLPDMPEDYVHRIGRTGRAGEKGYAISFVSANARKLLKDIEKLIDREIPVMEMKTYDLDMSLLKKGEKKKKKQVDRRTERSRKFKDAHKSGKGAQHDDDPNKYAGWSNKGRQWNDDRSDQGKRGGKRKECFERDGRDERADRSEDAQRFEGERGERRFDKRDERGGKKRMGDRDERRGWGDKRSGKRDDKRSRKDDRKGGKGKRSFDRADDRRGKRSFGDERPFDKRKGDRKNSRDDRDSRGKRKDNRFSDKPFDAKKGKKKDKRADERRGGNDVRSFGERKLRGKKSKRYTSVED